jgi:hypothetical protein
MLHTLSAVRFGSGRGESASTGNHHEAPSAPQRTVPSPTTQRLQRDVFTHGCQDPPNQEGPTRRRLRSPEVSNILRRIVMQNRQPVQNQPREGGQPTVRRDSREAP